MSKISDIAELIIVDEGMTKLWEEIQSQTWRAVRSWIWECLRGVKEDTLLKETKRGAADTEENIEQVMGNIRNKRCKESIFLIKQGSFVTVEIELSQTWRYDMVISPCQAVPYSSFLSLCNQFALFQNFFRFELQNLRVYPGTSYFPSCWEVVDGIHFVHLFLGSFISNRVLYLHTLLAEIFTL